MQIVAISDIHEISREWKYLLDNSVHKNYEVAVYVTGRSSFPDMLDGIPIIYNFLRFIIKVLFLNLFCQEKDFMINLNSYQILKF